MGPTPLPGRRRSNLPALGVACLAIPAVFFGVLPRLAPGDMSAPDAISFARTRGLVPADERLRIGERIYQWDPDLEKFPPLFIGTITAPRVMSQGGPNARIKSPNRLLDGSLLDIHPNGLRYWVRK